MTSTAEPFTDRSVGSTAPSLARGRQVTSSVVVRKLTFRVSFGVMLIRRTRCRMPAVQITRLEGLASQQIEVADITRELRDKSDYELQFYVDHGCWPEEENSETPDRTQ